MQNFENWVNLHKMRCLHFFNIHQLSVLFCLQRRREECERKARRGEMDPRLEFAFQLLMDATGLPRHEIMNHVFEGNMASFHNFVEYFYYCNYPPYIAISLAFIHVIFIVVIHP